MQCAGREAELTRLEDAITTSLTGARGGVIVLRGPRGIGKTVLAGELLDRVHGRVSGAAIARGRCVPASESPEAYHAFITALQDLANDRTSDAVSRDTVSSLLAELAPYWLSVVPLVGSLLSAGYSTVARLREKKPPTREALFGQYVSLVERLASTGPLVVFLEDLQHADSGSIGLLSYLGRSIRELPVVVLATLTERDTPVPEELGELLRELERERLALCAELGELDEDGVAALLRMELGSEASPALRRRVRECAGGNPLYVSELCRLLRQTGALIDRSGAWDLGTTGLVVPSSAEGVIEARLQRLAAEDLRVLQYASVEGRQFHSTVLARLLELDELTVLDRLTRIEQEQGLVHAGEEIPLSNGDTTSRFHFASAPVHTVLYAQVVGKRRVLLHRRMVEVLEELFAGDLERVAGRLLHHCREGRAEQAIAHYEAMAAAKGWRSDDAPHPEEHRGDQVLAASIDNRGGVSETERAPPTNTASVFVGREAELETLTAEVRRAIDLGAGVSLFVQGPPGAGKTSLVHELLDRLGRENRELTVARGRCLPTFGSADPYLPFVDAICDLSDERTLGFTDTERFADLLADIAPYWISAVPAVGNLLSATLSTARALRGTTKPKVAPSREALFIQYVELIGELARRSPLVLFFDDLHWADHASVALLSHLASGIANLPVVLIGTLRNDEVERDQHPLAELIRTLELTDQAHRIQVEELGGEALDALLRAEFGGDVSEPLRRFVVQAAGGNPLFASEFCRLLRQSGAVQERLGEWFLVEDAERLEVPRSAEAVIESRIRRLGTEDLRVLQYASVEGNEFDSALLSRLVDLDELRVLETLDELQRQHQLVRVAGQTTLPGGEVATVFRFRHALVQTVIYRQVRGKRRVLLHRQAANALEALLNGEAERAAGKLARHFHQGRVRERAYHYACTAGQAARAVFAHWEAEELFRIALENSPSDAENASLQERLGDIYDTVGYYSQAVTSYQEALSRSALAGPGALRLRRKILFTEKRAGLISSAEVLERVLHLLGQAEQDQREHCHLLMILGLHPDATAPLEALQHAVDIAETLGDPTLLAQALELLAGRLIFSARTRDAFPHLSRALAVSDVDADPVRAARNYNIAGIGYAKLGAYQEALHAFREMLAIYERVGDPNGIGIAALCMGSLQLRMGEFHAADELLQRARTIHERRDRATSIQSLFLLAESARLTGCLKEATARYRALWDRARELEHWDYEAISLAGMGLCHLSRDCEGDARACMKRALRVIRGRNAWFEDRDIIEIFLSRMEERDGQPELAVTRLAEAARVLRGSDVYLWARVELERARLLASLDPSEGLELLDEVIDHAAEISSPPLHAQIAEVRRLLNAARPTLTTSAT